MDSSGTTALATTDDTAVTVTGIGKGQYSEITFITTGAAPGFFSLDGGTIWGYIPAGANGGSRTLRGGFRITGAVQIKRIAGGPNMTGVFVDAH